MISRKTLIYICSIGYDWFYPVYQVCHPDLGCIHSSWATHVSLYSLSHLVSADRSLLRSANMYVNLYGNSTAFQTLYMLQGMIRVCVS